jgi:hypothetical protein
MTKPASSDLVSKNPTLLEMLWPHLAPIASTALANIPVYYGFIAKSSLQMKQGFPRLTIGALAFETLRSSPTVGVCVGTQIMAQHLFEKKIFNIDPISASFKEKLLSAIAVGALSAPAYAAMNAQTMGKTIRYAFLHFSKKQAMAITMREGAFLMGLEMADPICDVMKKRFSKETSDFLGGFISGVFGSIVGHPADTYLTLEQNKMKVTNFSCLYRGAMTRAIAVGAFSMCYHVIHKKIEKLL